MHTAPYFTAFGLLITLMVWKRLSHFHGPEAENGLGVFSGLGALALAMLIGLEIVQAPPWYLHLCGLALLVGQILMALGFEPVRASLRPRGLAVCAGVIGLSAIGIIVWTFVGNLE